MVATQKQKIRTMSESEVKLPDLFDATGFGCVTVICREGRPFAMVVPYSPLARQRKPGSLKGRVRMADDFDETPESVIADFEKQGFGWEISN